MSQRASSDFVLLQWNCQGLRGKKDEILQYISDLRVDILVLQETRLENSREFNLQGYNSERCEGHFNRASHGGVATFIHSSLPYERVNLNSPLQAVAVRVTLAYPITICNIYSINTTDS